MSGERTTRELAIAHGSACDAIAKARETVAAWMIANGFATGHGDTIEELLGELKGQVDEVHLAAIEALADNANLRTDIARKDEALKYARRFLKPENVDMAYIDAALNPLAPPVTSG